MTKNKLEQLRQFSTVVSDTGDIDAIKQYSPTDATTNPSLVFAAAQMPQYQHLIEDAISWAHSKGGSVEHQLKWAVPRVMVNFGCEILKIVPGRVSTEVDARLSFDAEQSIETAHKLIEMYEEAGIERERILIKLASTWEGIQACRQLESEGIHCNMTLMFSLPQAIGAAEAGATLVSPFVGRILDWYKKEEGVEGYPSAEDPGVKSVRQIYAYYKSFGYQTQVMGASFRNTGQILEIAGCDLITIAPKLLQELEDAEGTVEQKLSPEWAAKQKTKRMEIDEKSFRWYFNEEAMAVDKLADGIRRFNADLVKLKSELMSRLQSLQTA